MSKEKALAKAKWIFCCLDGFDSHEAPLLIVFFRSRLIAVCRDNLDVLIFKYMINNYNAENELITRIEKLFSIAKIRSQLYLERLKYAFKMASLVNPTMVLPDTANFKQLSRFSDVAVDNFLAIARSCLTGHMVDVVSALTKISTAKFQSLKKLLTKFGWKDGKLDSNQFEESKFDALSLNDELQKWLANDSFGQKLSKTKALLSEIEYDTIGTDNTLERVEQALHEIADDDRCWKSLNEKLLELRSKQMSLKAKCIKATQLLSDDIIRAEQEENYFHVRLLSKVAHSLSEKEESPESILIKYHGRSERLRSLKNVDSCIQNFQPYCLLQEASPYKHEEKVASLIQQLRGLSSLDNCEDVVKIVELLQNSLDLSQTKILCRDEKWLFFLRYSLKRSPNKNLLESFSRWLFSHEDADFIPSDIKEILMQCPKREAHFEDDHTEAAELRLTHESFFQVYGEIYHNALGEDLKMGVDKAKLIKEYSALLLKGKAIEIVNGDTGVMQLNLFRSICRKVSEEKPGMRVFVISLFELETSEKTFLTDFLSCEVKSSVGRVNNRSLFMRLIVLDESTRKVHGYDAIILFSLDGLAPRKVTLNPDSGRRDKLLSLFAVGMCDMAIIQSMFIRHQKDADALKVLIKLIVQLHMSKADSIPEVRIYGTEMSPRSKETYLKAVGEVFDEITPKDVRKKSIDRESLQKIKEHLENHHDLLIDDNFSQCLGQAICRCTETYHENEMNLLRKLFGTSDPIRQKVSFEYFAVLMESVWCSAKESESPWCNSPRDLVAFFKDCLKDARHYSGSVYFQKLLASAKELLNSAFRYHRTMDRSSVRVRLWSRLFETAGSYDAEEAASWLEGVWSEVEAEKLPQLDMIPSNCHLKCRRCRNYVVQREQLELEVQGHVWKEEVLDSLQKHRLSVFEVEKNLLRGSLDEMSRNIQFIFECSKTISDSLISELKQNPSGVFNEDDILNIQTEIWQRLTEKTYSSENNVNDQVLGVIKFYLDTEVKTIPEIVEEMNVTDDEMNSVESLNNLHVYQLDTEIDRSMLRILTNFKDDSLQSGIHVNPEMILNIEKKSSEILAGLLVDTKCTEQLKERLKIYAVQKILLKLEPLRRKWNHHNCPRDILSEKETEYKEEISIRLRSGFSIEAEGTVAAKFLMAVAKKKAVKVLYKEQIEFILNIPWMANSETIRLHYFEKLALEVSKGLKENALKHFCNPKHSIETWYSKEVNSYQKKQGRDTFKTTIRAELQRAIQNIRNCTDFSGIDSLFKEYIKGSEDVCYRRIATEGHGFDSMITSIERELNVALESLSDEIDGLDDASENSEIQSRLGCTEECFRCGSLCWGPRGHLDNVGDMSKHYACHQGRGLAKTSDGFKGALVANHCCEITNQDNEWKSPKHTVSILEASLSMVRLFFQESHWDIASVKNLTPPTVETLKKYGCCRQLLSEWKFPKHTVSIHEELMRWLFQELHLDIARVKNLTPPSVETLKKYGCWGLKLNHSLSTLREITNHGDS